MLAAPRGLWRVGVALKLNQIKLATRSYLRDRTNQATGTVASYAIAAGLFAAAAIFMIAACFVGITALFRWIEIKYGLFQAFGAVGALLVIVAAVLAGLAATKLRQAPPHFPSFASRLRVAVKANPVQPDQAAAVRDTAAAILRAPSVPVTAVGQRRRYTHSRSERDSRATQAGLVMIAILLGWATVRRRNQVGPTEA